MGYNNNLNDPVGLVDVIIISFDTSVSYAMQNPLMLKRQEYPVSKLTEGVRARKRALRAKGWMCGQTNRLRCAPTLRAAAFASSIGIPLALANTAAHAQTRDDKATSVDIGARGGLAKQTPPSSAADSDGQESSVEFSARAGFATEYIYRGTTLSAHQPAVGAVLEAAFNHFYAAALPFMPEHLDQSTPATLEDEQVSAVRIVLEHLLHPHRQPIKTLAHISVAGRQPDPRTARHWDHCRRLPMANAFISTVTIAASTGPVIRIRPPVANSISMTLARSVGVADTGPGSATTATGLNAAGIGRGTQSCCRHRNNWLV